MERTKDPLISFRNTIVGKDSKGRDTLSLYLNREEIPVVVDILNSLADNPTGVKFIFHTGKKTAQDTGRTFDSTFGFIKAVQTAPTNGVRQAVPKDNANAAAVYDNINKTVG